MTGKLDLDPGRIACCRESADAVARAVLAFASERTTVSIERATLRLIGVEGGDDAGVPWVNRVVDGARSLLPG